MRNKFTSAPTLVSFLSFFLLSSMAITDLSAQMPKSRIHGTQGGWDVSSTSDERIQEFLESSLPKGYFRNLSNSMESFDELKDLSNTQDAIASGLAPEPIDKWKSADGSEWIIDDTTLEELENDPQKLIQLTKSGDRVVFNLTGVQKFKQTLVVDHELEFVSKSPKIDDNYDDMRREATFTCPDSGPFLRIKSSGFIANGFVVRRCTESAGEGTIIIQSNSRAAFDNSIFRGNKKRAIFVASHANLTLKNCYFENNGNQNSLGGAISAQNSMFLSIVKSHFRGNIAKSGGALHILNDAMVVIVSSIFSRNKAFQYGGSIVMWGSNNVIIMNTTLSENIAQRYGGGIWVDDGNNITIINATMFENIAQSYGGGIWVNDDNNITIINATMFGNKAFGGGGLVVNDGNNITIINTTLSGNYARHHYGGGIRASNGNNITIINTTMSGNNASFGGGIVARDSNHLTITNTTLSGNTAHGEGGGIFAKDSNHLTITNTTLSGNTAYDDGGGIQASNGNNITIINTTMSGNTAYDDGGGITVNDGNNLTIINTTLSRNRASSGGAMWINTNNTLNITSSRLFGNNASAFGGAMLFGDHNIAAIVNCSLHRNIAKWHGGALKFGLQCKVTIRHSLIQGNDASWGGVIYLDRNTRAEISSSDFSNNSASRGGIVYASMDCAVSIDQSKATKNQADLGACLYGVSLSTKVQDSSFFDNLSFGSGGCFYIDSSNAHFEKTSFTHNEAEEKGGAIYATSGTHLQLKASKVSSNLAAFNGGGIAMAFNSRIVCFNCTIENNLARRGGGVHIESETNQIIVAQFAKSTFQNNTASEYGGALVIKTFNSRRFECVDIVEPCSRVLLIETSFISNSAELSGSAIIATTLGHILVACENLVSYSPYDYSRFLKVEDIRKERKTSRMKQFDKSSPLCDSWKDNWLVGGTNGRMVGTFGQTINVMINSSYGPWINGSSKSEFTLHGVRNTKQFPTLIVSTTDTFGQTPAPTLFEEDALVLNSSSDILKDDIAFSFKSATCTISSLSSNFPRGNYTIEINPREEDVLERTNLTIVIIRCGINEELTKKNSPCQECRVGMYNFNGSMIGGCSLCPKGANCTGNYSLPIGGYWNKSPCHARVKRCIVEEACRVQNRLEKLENLTRELVDCNLSDTMLSNYSKIQCREGYKGPLCGSCKKSYGLSSNSECSKCAHDVVVSFRFIGAIVYLLIGTIITIKGVLPSNSGQQGLEVVEVPMLEHDNNASIYAASSSQVREEVEDNNQDPLETIVEGDTNPLDSSFQKEDEVEVTKQKLISLNYFQVTSTAAGMDVEWTKKILDMLQGLNMLGAATTDSISYSFDCLFSSASNSGKAVWRLLFSLIVPLIVITLLCLHWGYKSMTKHSGNLGYFLRRLTLTVITVTYATYFDLTQVAMRTFSCVVVHDNVDAFSNAISKYWVGDTFIKCYKDTHIVLICVSLVVVALVTIGFPIFSSFSLNQHKSEVRETSSWTHDTLGFLGGPFKQNFIYWECVTMIKKAILSIIIVFSYSLEVQSQGLLILLVLVFFLYIHFLFYPYDKEYHTLNYYESGSLLVSCVTYTLIQFFNVEKFSHVARSIVSLSVIAINVGFVCLMAYKIIKDLIHLLRALLKSQNIHVPKNLNVISLIRVYSINRKSR